MSILTEANLRQAFEIVQSQDRKDIAIPATFEEFKERVAKNVKAARHLSVLLKSHAAGDERLVRSFTGRLLTVSPAGTYATEEEELHACLKELAGKVIAQITGNACMTWRASTYDGNACDDDGKKYDIFASREVVWFLEIYEDVPEGFDAFGDFNVDMATIASLLNADAIGYSGDDFPPYVVIEGHYQNRPVCVQIHLAPPTDELVNDAQNGIAVYSEEEAE